MKKYFVNNIKNIMAMGLSKAAAAVFGAGIPIITAELVNNIDHLSWNAGVGYVLAYVCTIVCLMISLYLCKISSYKMARNVNYQLKSDLVDHVLRMQSNDYYKKDNSFYVSLATEDAKNAYYSYYECVIEGATSALNMVIYTVLMLQMNWIMGTVIAVCSFLCMLVPEVAGKKLSSLKMEFLNKHGEHIGILTEIFRSYVLVNRRTRKQICELHRNACKEREDANYRWNSFRAFVEMFSGSCTYVINIAAFLCGVILIKNDMIQTGDFVGLLAFIEFMVGPLQDVVFQYMEIKSSKELITKIKGYLSIELKEQPICKDFCNKISVKNLSTKVGEFELNDISLEFEKNKKYAIVGKSGSGKSTLLRTLMGCNPEYTGEVTVDGVNIKEMDNSFVFSNIDQDIALFSGSAKDNITIFGSYEDDMLEKYVEEIQAEVVMRDKVENQGGGLSGGEKNKLAILRALVKGGKVLFCDEMFAALDEKNKKLLSSYLLTKPDLTVISITHDVSDESLVYYDEIIVMNEGRVAFCGKLEELRKLEGNLVGQMNC